MKLLMVEHQWKQTHCCALHYKDIDEDCMVQWLVQEMVR